MEILETRVNGKFEDAKASLATKGDVANAKVDIIKWVVVLVIGLYIALIGSIAALLKLMVH